MFSLYGPGKEHFDRREGNCPNSQLIVNAGTQSCVHCNHLFSADEICSINSQAEIEHHKFRISMKSWSVIFICAFLVWAILW